MHNPQGTGHFPGRFQDQLGGLNGKVRRTCMANSPMESSVLISELVCIEALIGCVGEVLAKILTRPATATGDHLDPAKEDQGSPRPGYLMPGIANKSTDCQSIGSLKRVKNTPILDLH
jgi:hypothetical protein